MKHLLMKQRWMRRIFWMMLATLFLIELKELRAKEPAALESALSKSGGDRADAYASAEPGSRYQKPDENIKDLGTFGETFPIQEQSLLDVIKSKLKSLAESGKLEEHQKTIASKAKEQLNRPNPVKGVTKTTTPRSFAYNPSITIPYDLKDHLGRVFHSKGTQINPLDTHSLNYALLFVDGDDAHQVAWAIQQHQAAEPLHKPKIILVQGAPLKLSKKLNLPIYFDQSGVLIKKLGIACVPTRVSQKDKMLLIEEIDPKVEHDLPEPREPK